MRRHGGIVRRTVGEVVAEWLAWCVAVRGIKPLTVGSYGKDFVLAAAGQYLRASHRDDARAIYQRQIEHVSAHTKRPVSAATHHLFLWVAKRLWVWGVSQGYSRTNPWAKVQPIGRQTTGKTPASDR